MSTPTSPFNPSRQVERIREILVGRQMATVERRLSRLEHRASAPAPDLPERDPRPGPLATPQPNLGADEESRRRADAISKLATRIQENVEELRRGINSRPPAVEIDERFGSLRTEFRRDHEELLREVRQETRERITSVHELASRISRLATEQANRQDQDDGGAAVARLRTAIEDWQQRLAEHLENREQWMVSQMRGELTKLRKETWHWLGELHRMKADRSELSDPYFRPKPQG